MLSRHQWPCKLRLTVVLVSCWTCTELMTQFAIDAANQHRIVRWIDVTSRDLYMLAFQGFVTYPVTVASCERPFSTPHFGGWRHGLETLWENSVWLTQPRWTFTETFTCRSIYWSLRLQEAKNSVYRSFCTCRPSCKSYFTSLLIFPY